MKDSIKKTVYLLSLHALSYKVGGSISLIKILYGQKDQKIYQDYFCYFRVPYPDSFCPWSIAEPAINTNLCPEPFKRKSIGVNKIFNFCWQSGILIF